ncbi:beta-1,6-N-acetylglucosaminyltransferase [Roseinatronobacter alkalisoli]|uniref:Peptide O-xylosyltransferase n=1 Tax=Roseinatronobacter alkalisoli TaxID=3028235 RepID=A0ABT5T5U5_9RHOB|nr:beta-1,6-N-acetylglucosaminyltransferase [Roseinatronobacter sp. HJB301]MDD7970466.1 beta-1,6-N-acetylglucosaminyltransferase [Roseinatronobacter sp. HJB301]
MSTNTGQTVAVHSAPLGVVILCHTALHRTAQLARFWLAADCPVVIHVDRAVSADEIAEFRQDIGAHPLLRFSTRFRCEWGTWPIVAATQAASQQILAEFPQVEHVLLASGACLPLRPASELIDWLAQRRGVDFIESVSIGHAPWIKGGLSEERFTLHFPLSWKRHKWAFDLLVEVQRRLGIRREVPRPLQPHMGSQWWCLSRKTLQDIFAHPKRARYDRYFKGTWIPDESYFQTMVRLVSDRIESRSLTLVKFDRNGRPNLFYDDHMQLLRRSDCFVARKIWPEAQGLYDFFLSGQSARAQPIDPQPAKIDRYFELAARQRSEGRAGLYMQSRFPLDDSAHTRTAAPYSVFCGFEQVFRNFDFWLSNAAGCRVHGHLYAPEKVEFHGGAQVYHGAISNSAALRDYNPRMFLTNLIWATRGERQCFSYNSRDRMTPELNWFMATDRNARISVISGAFLLPLFRGDYKVNDLLGHIGWLQKREQEFISVLRSKWALADIRIWTLREFLQDPQKNLSDTLQGILPDTSASVSDLPEIKPLDGFEDYLAQLRNMGLPPVLLQDYKR